MRELHEPIFQIGERVKYIGVNSPYGESVIEDIDIKKDHLLSLRRDHEGDLHKSKEKTKRRKS